MSKTDSAERVKDLFAMIEANAPEAMTEGGWIEILEYAAKFHNYSANNQFLIQLQYPQASAVASFKRWKELGRTVKKGEKAIRVLAPRPYAFGIDEDGNRVPRKEIGDDSDVEIVEGVSFKDVPVFAIEQTEGAEIPSKIVRYRVEGKRGNTELLTGASALRAVGIEVAARLDLPVEFKTLKPGLNGFTDHKRIVVSDRNDEAQQAKTIAHEIAHVMLKHGVERDQGRHIREIEAESVAFVVLGALGFDTSAYSFGYVGGWSEFDGEKIASVRDRVVTVSRELLAHYEAVVAGADVDPVEATPVESAPVEAVPVEAVPVEVAAEAVPVEIVSDFERLTALAGDGGLFPLAMARTA